MWEHLSRNGIDFFNFGQGFEFSGAEEEQWHKYTGVKMGVMFPMPKPLFDKTSRKYATYNTSVPDQFRWSKCLKRSFRKSGSPARRKFLQ